MKKRMKNFTAGMRANAKKFLNFGNEHIRSCAQYLMRADLSSSELPPEITVSCGAVADAAALRFLLLERGADVNGRDSEGNTALHGAVVTANLNLIRFLTENGADPNALSENKYAPTPLCGAARTAKIKIIRYLLEHTDAVPDGHFLVIAAESGSLKLMKYLAETRKLDMNLQDSFGWTPVMGASVKGRLAVLRYLLENCGADPFLCDTEGKNALRAAELGEQKKIIRYLTGTVHMNPRDGRLIE